MNNHEKSVIIATKLMSSIGLNLDDDNYRGTPERFVLFLEDFTKALKPECQEELDEILDVHFPKHKDLNSYYKGMIIQSPIRIYSVCSHHLLPVIYDISIGYLPKDNRQLGFSKITRALRLMARRPMNQEDFTQYIVESLNKRLRPEGLAVVVRGTHMCMSMRGASVDTNNITSAIRGQLRKSISSKEEFMKVALHYDRTRV